MEFAPDGKTLFRATERTDPKGQLVAYDTSSWKPSWVMDFEKFTVAAIAIKPDGALIAVGGDQFTRVSESAKYPLGAKMDRVLRIIDIKQKKLIAESGAGAFNSLAWSPDGSRIAVAVSGFIYILNSATSQQLSIETLKTPQSTKIAFSPNGRFFLESFFNSRGSGLGINIWNGERVKLLQHIDGDISSIAISRDGKYLAIGSLGRTSIWQFIL